MARTAGREGTSSPPADEHYGETARRYGRLAGVLAMSGSVSSVPSSFLIEPAPPSAIYLLGLLAFASGAACFVIPWERLPWGAFHVLAGLGTVFAATAVEIAGPPYSFYYVFIAIYVAYVFESRLAVMGHLLFIGAALLAPLAWDPEASRETVRRALLFIPALAITSGVVVLLRQRLEQDRRRYSEFAEEAYDIALRIRRPERSSEGGASSPPGHPRG
jgi:hypothetical protein